MLPASPSDLRSLVEEYIYPILVCDEDGTVRFCNGPAQAIFGENQLQGRPLPNEWLDKDRIDLETEIGTTTYRLRWNEILWDGNPAWYLITYPAEGGGGGPEELQSRLEQSMEMAASELEKRQHAEGEREKLEAKLRDLHQRSVAKLEAARTALETEKAERAALAERLGRLKDETDELKAQLEEKRLQVEEATHRSGEAFESLKAELLFKEQALLAAEEKSERYRKVYEDLDAEMTRSQEQSALLTAKLHTAEARLERAQRLLDGSSIEAVTTLSSQAEASEMSTLRERIVELEAELRRTKLDVPTEPLIDPSTVADLESECARLRQELVSAQQALAAVEQPTESVVTASVGNEELHALQTRLSETTELLAELRLHKEQELSEARANLAKLQALYSGAKSGSNGHDPALADLTSEELTQARVRISELEEELSNARGPEREAEMLARMEELEERLVHASSFDSSELRASQERVTELEGMLSRSRTEASPEELNAARNRIAELENRLSQPQSPGDSGSEENQRLTSELAQAHAQLNEMARELRRTIESDRETKKLAYADGLTGLPNYNLTGQYLQVCFERSSRGEGALALILIDLDHFRRVNEALGSKAGDELLRQVGARLQRTVTEKDTAIARRGEDEFMVVAFLEGATVDGEALSARVRGIANNLLGELIKPFEIADQRVQTTASMGVALYPGPASDREGLLEQAEHAMYKAKESGRARVSFYTQEIHQTRDRKIRVERELRQSVADGNFTMIYQPILEIPSGKVVGLEALLRWSHPQRGLLEPAEFLALAEETGVILPISDQVLSEAMLVMKQKFMKRRFMSFNLSHRQLVDVSFPARFMKHLERAQISPKEVMVEVSERNISMDPERSRNTLASLGQWGVGIALDDFGSGSSELSLFRDFPIRLLKIDGSLIKKLTTDRETAKLCYAIARMSAALEIPVLAEGVESREQLEMISNFGCQYAQGIFLREPMNVNQLIQVM